MRKHWEKIKLWAKENWPLWVLILISVVVYHPWLSFGIFFNGDYGFTFFERELDFLRYSAWDSQSGLGAPNLVIWMWFWRILPGFFAFFHLSSDIWDKFFIFWPLIFLTPLFSYLFAKEVLKDKLGATVAVIVFSFNAYYLAINTQGHFSLMLAGIFALPALSFFWRYFETGRKKNLITSALVCLVVGGYDFRVFYILFFIVLAWPLWLLFGQKGTAQKKIFFRNYFSALTLFFGLLFLFNLFWLVPTAMTGSLASNEVVSRDLVPNNYYLDLRKALTLFHPFWNGGEPEWFDDQNIPVYFWLVPLMVVLGAYWNRNNRKILFWFLVALVGVFLSKQDALPLQSAYVWLHQNFPGFNAFREASKFYFIIAPAYAILIGAFVSYVLKHWSQKKYLKYGAFTFASLLFLWNAKPILTGEMYSIFTPKTIPTDELKIRNHIVAKKDSFRTLWVEKETKWISYSNLHPAVSLKNNPWGRFLDLKNFQGEELTDGEKARLLFSQKYAARLLDESGVRYVIADAGDFSALDELVTGDSWKELDLGLEKKTVLENLAVRPRVYFTEQKETIHRDIPFQPINYYLVNSSRWDLELPSLTQPGWINFSENYHPDWQLVCGDFRWHSIFGKKSDRVYEQHIASDAGLNAYLIDPEKIQKSCPIQLNGKTRLSLFYLPQSYLYLGGIISLFTVFLSLLALVFWKEKSYNKKVE